MLHTCGTLQEYFFAIPIFEAPINMTLGLLYMTILQPCDSRLGHCCCFCLSSEFSSTEIACTGTILGMQIEFGSIHNTALRFVSLIPNHKSSLEIGLQSKFLDLGYAIHIGNEHTEIART